MILFAAAMTIAVTQGATTIVVSPDGPVKTVTAALAVAREGDRVLVKAGTYREPTIIVRTARVTLEGDGWPVLDGQGERAILIVEADDVTVRGLEIAHTGLSQLEDRAGIRVRNVDGCLVEKNRLRDNLFGIYLQRSANCTVRDNDIVAHGTSQATSGNGIHLWYSPYAIVADTVFRAGAP